MTERARILIVDDSTVIRKTLDLVLRQAGYETEEATNGIEALERLLRPDAPPIALAFIDVNMPRMDGLTLIREIRRDEYYRFLPVVILSTEATQEDQAAGRKAGANAYIVKPASAETIVEYARRHVGDRL